MKNIYKPINMIMRKIYLFLIAFLTIGMYVACDEEKPVDEPVNQNEDKTPTDSVTPQPQPQPTSLYANSFKLGKDTVRFGVFDTLTVQEGAMRVFGNFQESVDYSKPFVAFTIDLADEFLNKEITLGADIISDTVYDALSFSFDFMNAGRTDSLSFELGWGWTESQGTFRMMEGVINGDTVLNFIKSGTLCMGLDNDKKLFTFKANTVLYNDSVFEVNLCIPFTVKYIFNFFTYSHETWDPTTHKTLTKFDEFENAVGPEGYNTFTIEAADTTAKAKFDAFKEAIGRFTAIIDKIDDSKAREDFYDVKDCFMIKLITWGYGGHNRVIAYKKWWKNRACETWIPEDDYIYDTLLYYPGDEDFWEHDED